ncbi:hypothetical protein TIFTF001_040518 [Ficus carica]|uniref:Uncharacterized protein n=1 Tax=Ficus carica TaxID=3494 RepID=A0AA87YX27_FICCA|nr:hypothetical protein TIFTF001_040518 [Ficus carica]
MGLGSGPWKGRGSSSRGWRDAGDLGHGWGGIWPAGGMLAEDSTSAWVVCRLGRGPQEGRRLSSRLGGGESLGREWAGFGWRMGGTRRRWGWGGGPSSASAGERLVVWSSGEGGVRWRSREGGACQGGAGGGGAGDSSPAPGPWCGGGDLLAGRRAVGGDLAGEGRGPFDYI